MLTPNQISLIRETLDSGQPVDPNTVRALCDAYEELIDDVNTYITATLKTMHERIDKCPPST